MSIAEELTKAKVLSQVLENYNNTRNVMSKQEYQKDKLYKSCVLLSEVCNDLITFPELRTKVETILEEIRAKYEEYP